MNIVSNRASGRATLGALLILLPITTPVQNRPSFSGDWVLVSATASGSSGRGGGASGERPITSNTASGAAFNCGRECTISMTGQALTIEQALLGSDPKPAPAITLQLNGREMSVVNSFNPTGQIPVTASWNGNKVEIVSKGPARMTTQVVSVEASQLVVVTSSADDFVVTLKYKKR